MKKTFAFLLALTLLFGLSTAAFADTSGGQTITVEVPDATAITPAVGIDLPVVGQTPDSGAFSAGVDSDLDNENYNKYDVDSLQITLNGEAFTQGMTYDHGVYVYTFQVSINNNLGGYVFSADPANVDGRIWGDAGIEDHVYDTAAHITLSEDGRTATYQYTYTVTPSWTLTIPSSSTITYGLTNNPVSLTTSISNVTNMLDTTPIYVHATHTGSFVNTTDSGNTIPFALKVGSTEYAANTPFLVNTNSGEEGYGRSDYVEISDAVISITTAAWNSAAPGTYETVISYSSGLTN